MSSVAGPMPAGAVAATQRSERSRVRALAARLPVAAYVCALIAVAHGVIWSVLDPNLQGPDELGHISNVEYVSQNFRPAPSSNAIRLRRVEPYSRALQQINSAVPFSTEGPPSWSPAGDRALRAQLARSSQRARTASGYLTNNPIGYYAVEAVPVAAASAVGVGILGRIFIMRLVSTLLAGLTALFCFLFLRELLPRDPWTWTVGGLAVAFQPVLGFMGGSVNPDNLLFAAAAALFFALARAFHRGLTVKRGLGIGVAALVGALTKGTMFGLLPGAALGTLLLAARLPRGRRREGVAAIVAGAAVFVLPFGLWLVVNSALLHRDAATTTSGVRSSSISGTTAYRGQLSYLWQSFLPRLPGMNDLFPKYFPPKPGRPRFLAFPNYVLGQVYFQGFVGRFGWFAFNFPRWVNAVGITTYVALIAIALSTIARTRGVLRRRWAELLTYTATAAGVMVLVTVTGYIYRTSRGGTNFEQTRYLMPLIPLYGAVVAVGARAFGRRWGPPVGAFLVVLAIGHSLFSLLLMLGHYYG